MYTNCIKMKVDLVSVEVSMPLLGCISLSLELTPMLRALLNLKSINSFFIGKLLQLHVSSTYSILVNVKCT